MFRSLILVSLLAAAGPPGLADAHVPSFSDFPVQAMYAGKVARPQLVNRQDRLYRSRLLKAAQARPNFAGRYIVTTFGCGAGCVMGAVLDAVTGHVTHFPFTVSAAPSDVKPVEFRPDSRLIVFRGSRNEAPERGTYYYAFDGRRFQLVQQYQGASPPP